MPEQAQLRAAAKSAATVEIVPVTGRAIYRLKSWLPDAAPLEQPVTFAGLQLPMQVGATLTGPVHVLCVGPHDWLLVMRALDVPVWRERFLRDTAPHGLALVDVTDSLATISVQGAPARVILSKGGGLDVHPRAFAPGRCARTRLAQVPVVVECVDEPLSYELTVARSYLQYLRAWLADAAVGIDDPLE